jgi:hypothetical protein
MGKRGRRSEEKSAGARAASACSASDECPYRVCSSAGDRFLSSGFSLASAFGSGAGAGAGEGVAEDLSSGMGASRVAAVVESARVDHVSRRERSRSELASASGVDAAENETARTRAMRRRRILRKEEGETLCGVVRLFVSLASLAQPLAGLTAAHHPHLSRMRFMTLSV